MNKDTFGVLRVNEITTSSDGGSMTIEISCFGKDGDDYKHRTINIHKYPTNICKISITDPVDGSGVLNELVLDDFIKLMEENPAVGFPKTTMESELKGIYSKEKALEFNKECGELWIFEHRGMEVWYNGETPDRGWSISGGIYGNEDEDQTDREEDNILWTADFLTSSKLDKQNGIMVGGVLFQEVVIEGYRKIDPDLPYINREEDAGKKGYIECVIPEGHRRVECELVDVWFISDHDPNLCEYEWMNEITGLIRIKINWDVEV